MEVETFLFEPRSLFIRSIDRGGSIDCTTLDATTGSLRTSELFDEHAVLEKQLVGAPIVGACACAPGARGGTVGGLHAVVAAGSSS